MAEGDGVWDLWRRAEPRVRRALGRIGISEERRDDLLQETALRMLRARPDLETVEQVAAWAYTVARRIDIDLGRRRGRETASIDDVAEVEAADDVVEHALQRLDLETVLAAVARLSPMDQAALFDIDRRPADRTEAVRWAVRRHRARQRLARLLGGSLGGVGALGLIRRRPRPPVRRRRRPALVAAVATVAAVAVAVTVVPSRMPVPGIGGAAPAPSVVGLDGLGGGRTAGTGIVAVETGPGEVASDEQAGDLHAALLPSPRTGGIFDAGRRSDLVPVADPPPHDGPQPPTGPPSVGDRVRTASPAATDAAVEPAASCADDGGACGLYVSIVRGGPAPGIGR